jgi:hypothetical protein
MVLLSAIVHFDKLGSRVNCTNRPFVASWVELRAEANCGLSDKISLTSLKIRLSMSKTSFLNQPFFACIYRHSVRIRKAGTLNSLIHFWLLVKKFRMVAHKTHPTQDTSGRKLRSEQTMLFLIRLFSQLTTLSYIS